MRISLAALNVAVDPNLIELLKTVSINTSRSLLSAVTLTDSSTGVAAATLAAINTQNARVAASGSNLAPRAAFNTAIGKANNAIAVLRDYLNTNALALLGVPQLSGGNGTVAVAGTIPAQDKVLTATDGSSDAAMLRSEFNAAIVTLRNNLATIVRSYNTVATAVGGLTLSDLTGGSASPTGVLVNSVTAGTAVLTASVAAGDLATDAAVDAALTAFAADVATVAAKLSANVLHDASVLNVVVPVTLVQ